MGHDLYIQARIKEKRTGRVISRGDSDDYGTEDDTGFFDICWWCGSPECDVRIRMIEICGSHGGTDYTDSERICPPENSSNLPHAHKLHDLIATLDEINDENKVLDACFLYKEYIPDEKDLRHFYENPLAYEWEFRIWNSY